MPKRRLREEASQGPNPYVFVVGCPRSGTTLLQRMLDHHPLLTVANDSHFIPRAVAPFGASADLPLTADLVERVVGYRRFPRLGVPAEDARAAADRATTYAEFVSELYGELARLRGKPLAGEKTPDYVRCLPLLHALFPDARVIHIVRDGRDVALSTLEWASEERGPGRLELWREEPVGVCALWWRWQVEGGRRDGAELGPEVYREIRYEDLVADPAQKLRELAAFLGLPFAPDMAAFHTGKTRRDPGLSAKKAWLPATPGLRDWRRQMPPRELELFEAIAGPSLSSFGYERAIDGVSPEIAASARRCETWWRSEMSERRAKRERRIARRAAAGAPVPALGA